MEANSIKIKRGQVWKKRLTVHPKPFYAIIVSKGKNDKWKAKCSDGNTHTFNRYILLKKFDLVEN